MGHYFLDILYVGNGLIMADYGLVVKIMLQIIKTANYLIGLIQEGPVALIKVCRLFTFMCMCIDYDVIS